MHSIFYCLGKPMKHQILKTLPTGWNPRVWTQMEFSTGPVSVFFISMLFFLCIFFFNLTMVTAICFFFWVWASNTGNALVVLGPCWINSSTSMPFLPHCQTPLQDAVQKLGYLCCLNQIYYRKQAVLQCISFKCINCFSFWRKEEKRKIKPGQWIKKG